MPGRRGAKAGDSWENPDTLAFIRANPWLSVAEKNCFGEGAETNTRGECAPRSKRALALVPRGDELFSIWGNPSGSAERDYFLLFDDGDLVPL